VKEPRELRRVVLREELYVLTGSTIQAIILGQFLYWQQRVKDIDKYILEEQERLKADSTYAGEREGSAFFNTLDTMLTHGWMYKSVAELKEECLLDVSDDTVRRALKALVAQGWLLERNNPVHRWDRTKQYRVNLQKIQHDLLALGYPLSGYTLENVENISIPHGAECIPHGAESKPQFAESKPHGAGAIPETITEIINRDYKDILAHDEQPHTANNSDEIDEQQNRPRPPFKTKRDELLFDLFWKAYPKKKSKGQAERAWAKLRPDDELFQQIMSGLEKAKQSRDWKKNDGQFIPYPATWLNSKGWEDEYEDPPVSSERYDKFAHLYIQGGEV